MLKEKAATTFLSALETVKFQCHWMQKPIWLKAAQVQKLLGNKAYAWEIWDLDVTTVQRLTVSMSNYETRHLNYSNKAYDPCQYSDQADWQLSEAYAAVIVDYLELELYCLYHFSQFVVGVLLIIAKQLIKIFIEGMQINLQKCHHHTLNSVNYKLYWLWKEIFHIQLISNK